MHKTQGLSVGVRGTLGAGRAGVEGEGLSKRRGRGRLDGGSGGLGGAHVTRCVCR